MLPRGYHLAACSAGRPDLILLCGNLVENAFGLGLIEPEITAAEIKGLKAQFGVFAALGNHDWWYNAPFVKLALEGAGISVLEIKQSN